MAIVTRTDVERTLTAASDVEAFLGRYGIWYRRFEHPDPPGDDAAPEEVLAAYAEPIEVLKRQGGYVTADVIDIKPDTPGLRDMLDKFNKEHWHDEDEVRFVVAGRGVFHIHPRDDAVFRIEVVAGDMINVPRGTWHWFDLCEESRIRAIRLFQDRSGWTPHYTGSEVDAAHQPLCFGPSYLPPGAAN